MSQDRVSVDTLVIRYVFEFEDGHTEAHEVCLDRASAELTEPPPEPLPDWTLLENQRCGNCPLSADQHVRCPAAVAIANLSLHFGHRDSYEPVKVSVVTAERTVMSKTSLQSALYSLMGLRMATSGCPILAKLRPMARFHLPFADADETVYRAVSMHLLGQFFRHLKGLSADVDLEELRRIYAEVHEVNLAFCRRLRQADAADANMNSLTVLDLLAQEVPFNIDDALAQLTNLFKPYMN